MDLGTWFYDVSCVEKWNVLQYPSFQRWHRATILHLHVKYIQSLSFKDPGVLDDSEIVENANEVGWQSLKTEERR